MINKCGILISKKTGTVTRGTSAVYLTDLDFADGIELFASTIANAQKLLSSLRRLQLLLDSELMLVKLNKY